jgi:hypothetical protein
MGSRAYCEKLTKKYTSGQMDASDKEILRLIEYAETGVSAKDIAIEVGQAHNTVGSKLRAMKNLGLIGKVGESHYAVWCTLDRVEVITYLIDARHLESAKRKGAHAVRAFLARRGRSDDWIKRPSVERSMQDEPVQIWRKAGEWATLPIRGPVSVWDLA